jgi:hypothetical protein
MQLWNRSMTSSRLRRLGCGVLGARDAARERRRTEAARAMARARARSSWSSLEPSGNAGGGDCSSSLEPAAIPRAGGGVGACGGAAAEASSAGGISWGRKDGGEGKGIGFGGFAGVTFLHSAWGVLEKSGVVRAPSRGRGFKFSGAARSGNRRLANPTGSFFFLFDPMGCFFFP